MKGNTLSAVWLVAALFTGSSSHHMQGKAPHWGWDAPALKELCSAVHLGIACLLTVLVALHIAAALKHLLVNRDGVFQRMLPHGTR